MSSKEVATLFVEIRGSFAKFQADFGALSKQFANMGRDTQRLGQQFSSIGSRLTKSVTLPIAGVGAASLKLVSDFQSSMSKVSALGEIFGADLEKLKQQALELGAKTQFSAQQAADGMGELAAAGFKTQQIYDAMPGVLDLAASAQIGVGAAAGIAVNALGAFQLKASDTGRVADVLARGAAEGTTSITDLAEALKYVAPVSYATGISLEETTAAITELSNSGIKGGQAGTALRAGMIRMVKPTHQAREAIAELGLQLESSPGRLKPLSEIIQQLADKHANLAQVTKLVGVESATAWQALVNNGGGALSTMTDKMNNAAGSAQQMAAILRDNLAGSTEQTKGAFETLGIAIGDALTPAARELLGVLQQLAQAGIELVAVFKTLPTWIQTVVIAVAALAAAAGPLLFILGTMTQGWAALLSLFSKLGPVISIAGAGFGYLAGVVGLLLTPLGLLAAAVGAAIAVWYEWDTVKQVFGDVVTAIGGWITKLSETVNAWIDQLEVDVGNGLKVIADAFIHMKDVAIQAVADLVNGVTDWFTNKLASAKASVVGFTDDVARGFSYLYDQVVGHSFVPDLVTEVLALMDQMGTGMTTSAATGTANVATSFENLGKNVGTTMRGIKKDGESLAADLTSTFSSIFQNFGVGGSFSKLLGGLAGGLLTGQGKGGAGLLGNLLNGQLGLGNIFGGGASGGSGGGGIVGQILGGLGLGSGKSVNFSKDVEDAMGVAKLGSITDSVNTSFGGLSETIGQFGTEVGGASTGLTSELGGLSGSLGGFSGSVTGYAGAIQGSLAALSKLGKTAEGTGQALGNLGGTAIGGIFGGPVGAQIGGQIGQVIGGFIGKMFGSGPSNPETLARKKVEKYLEDTFAAQKNTHFYGPNGQMQQFDGNFQFGSSDRFNKPGWADQQRSKFGDQSTTVFDTIGKGLTNLLGITEDVGGQIGAILQEQFSGNIDNARILVQKLGISQEQMTKSFEDAGEKGSMSWHDVEVALQGVAAAYGEGLVAVGDIKGGFEQVINSAGQGEEAILGIKNAAVEAGEKGTKSFESWKAALIATGESPEYVNAFFTALNQRGLKSLDDIKNASTRVLGGVIADMQSTSPELAKQWIAAQAQAKQYLDTVSKIPDQSTKDVTLNVHANISDDAKKVLDMPSSSVPASADVPAFASGGVVNRPTLGLIGEAGPEAILPLSSLKGMMKPSSKIGSLQSSSGPAVHVTINAPNAQAGVGDEIRRVIKDLEFDIINRAVDTVTDLARRGGA